jgi:PBP1b-binding outer membrane lipoprotein LpoB
MKKLLAAMFVALLMVGCGEEAQNPEDSNDTENNTSALAPPVVQPVKAPFVEKWAEYSRSPNASPKRCVDLLEYTRGK